MVLLKNIVLIDFEDFDEKDPSERIVVGKVAETGVECKYAKKGDRIIFDRYLVDVIDIDGVRYNSILESSVIAIL